MSFGKRRIPKHLIIESYPRTKKFGYGWLIFALAILVLSMIVSVGARADALPEAEAGQLYLQNALGRFQASLHLDTEVEAQINGMIAEVTLSQHFRNDSDDWREGIYVFPLPENAAVNHMEMHIGERVIVGEIREKAEARRVYQEAKLAGKKASLTEQLRPNLFTQRVANIAPGQTVSVTLRYLHSVRFDAGEFSWHFPMTLTPRYSPDKSPGMPAEEQPAFNSDKKKFPANSQLAFLDERAHWQKGWAISPEFNEAQWPLPASVDQFSAASPEHRCRLTIALNSGLPLSAVNSTYHRANIVTREQRHHIQLDAAAMNRDFELTWRPEPSASPQAALFSETLEGEHYALLMMLPPTAELQTRKLPRDIVFVIDVSGSMGGSSIEQARASLQQALATLRPDDRFNVIAFESSYQKLFPGLSAVDAHHLRRAQRWVGELEAKGGTEMFPALQEALLQQTRSTGEALQQVVFITDGAVSNETQLFQLIRNQLGHTRLFTVGIGAAPNHYFMSRAAKFGRGSFVHVGALDQVAEKMATLFAKLQNAAARDIRIQWPGAHEMYPQRAPDIYFAEPLLVAVRSPNAGREVVIEGRTADQHWQQRIPLQQQQQAQGIATVWAREKITSLEDQKIAGGDAEALKEEIIAVALQHHLLSQHTSFVAVERVADRLPDDPLMHSPVQNMTPEGWQAPLRQVHYPSTATSATLTWWVGCFGIVALIFVARLRDE